MATALVESASWPMGYWELLRAFQNAPPAANGQDKQGWRDGNKAPTDS